MRKQAGSIGRWHVYVDMDGDKSSVHVCVFADCDWSHGAVDHPSQFAGLWKFQLDKPMWFERSVSKAVMCATDAAMLRHQQDLQAAQQVAVESELAEEIAGMIRERLEVHV